MQILLYIKKTSNFNVKSKNITKHVGVCMFMSKKLAKKVKKFCKKVLTYDFHSSILTLHFTKVVQEQ